MPPARFEMTFDLGNEAFDDDTKRQGEIARLLTETAAKVVEGVNDGFLFDVNGNKVGGWSFDPVDPAEEEVECVECGALNAPGSSECYQCGEDPGR